MRQVEWTADQKSWQAAPVSADGRVDFPNEATAARFTVAAEKAGDAVLRMGATGPVQVVRDGEVVLETDGAVPAIPDQNAVLVPLIVGPNALELRLPDGAACACYLRVTDSHGLPVTAH